MRLAEKVAFISGGGTGIGRATAETFAEQGAKVVISGLSFDDMKDCVVAIEAKGGEVIALEQDVTEEDSWPNVMAETIKKFGRLDIMVNNAGVAFAGNVEEETLEGWRKTQSVNIEGVFLGTKAAIKAMKDSGGGSIINISSIEGLIGEPTVAAYNASKGAVRIFSKSAALHCAQSGYNIRINTLHPGFIETAMTTTNVVEQFGEEIAAQIMDGVMAKVPLGRAGQPKEMANAILFLASDDSSYMTGAELVVDGGYTAQ
ncbi:MAG: glucose 1-dehydrogenase [Cellvibrionaceae bacterium]